MPRGSDLVFVGDVHLDRDDADMTAFLGYLDRLGSTAGRVVLMGDLFNLWIGDPRMEQAHHATVVAALRRMRRSGIELHYLEGNRDFRIGRWHAGTTFDRVSDRGLLEEWAGRRVWAAHGDLVNVRDLPYRAWRRVSRSGLAGAALSLAPERRRFAIAETIERRLRGTNASMKRAFPEVLVRRYAQPHLEGGADAVVLGHFHDEHDLSPPGPGRIIVVPAWKESRRHLRLGADGRLELEPVGT